MKCPHCEYVHGTEWVQEELRTIKGAKGDFYELPIKAERRVRWEDERTSAYACPNCGKMFIVT